MVNIREYQSGVSLYASHLRGVLDKTQGSNLCILSGNIGVLKLVLSFIVGKLADSDEQPIQPSALFDLDAELQRVQKLIFLVTVDDSVLVKEGGIQSSMDEQALKALRSLVSLNSYRRKLKSGVASLITVLSSNKMIPVSVGFMAGVDKDQVPDDVAQDCLDKFIKMLRNTPEEQVPPGFSPSMSFEKADKQDIGRISKVFKFIEDSLDSAGGESGFPLSDALAKILKMCRAVIKKKPELFLMKGLKTSAQFIKDLDEIILKVLYQKPSLLNNVVANFDSPSKGDILGEGLMGMVLCGTANERPAALKALEMGDLVRDALSAEGRTELISELRLRRTEYRHPNVVELLGIALRNDMLYLIFERLDSSLDYVIHGLKSRKLEQSEVNEIAHGVARALQFLHQRKVVHGALHPGNIILSGVNAKGQFDMSRFKVKLTDFGARTVKREIVLKSMMTPGPDMSSKLKIIEMYSAPEVLAEAKYTNASDMYSFALILWALGSGGARPFDGFGDDFKEQVVSKKARPGLDATSIPPFLKSIVNKGWTHEPWVRPSAPEVLKLIKTELAAAAERNSTKLVDADIIDNRASKTGGSKRLSFPSKTKNPRNLKEQGPQMVKGLAMRPQGRQSGRQSGSRLSRVRTSVQRPNQRSTSMSRTSVVLERQKFGFLDGVTPSSSPDIAVKIVKAMRYYHADAELQLKGISAIRYLMEDPEREVERWVMKTGAGQAVIAAMRNHMNEPAVLQSACGAIANLCQDTDNAEPLLCAGALDLILESMTKYPKDTDVIEEGLKALTNLSANEVEKKKWLIEKDVDELIVKCLVSFPQGKEIQGECFGAIVSLQSAYYSPHPQSTAAVAALKKERKQNKKKFEDFFMLKAHERVFVTLNNVRWDANLIVDAFGALAAMIAGVDARKNLIAKQKSLFKILRKALEEFATYPLVHEVLFNFLSLVACVKSCHKEMLKEGIHLLIDKSLEEFNEPDVDDNLQLYGVLTLHNMIMKDKKVAKVFRKGAFGVIVAKRVFSLYDVDENKILYKKALDLQNLVLHNGTYNKYYLSPEQKKNKEIF